MKNRWMIFMLLLMAPLLFAGCGGEPKLAIDESKLPPPRAEVDVKLDLHGAKLVINDQTLANMGANGVPGDVVDQLKSLSGQEYTTAADFVAAVKGAAGDGANPHMETIIMSSLVMDLADQGSAPQGEVTLAEAEAAAPPPPEKLMHDFEIIYFDFDKFDIKAEFEETIRRNAQFLLDNPSAEAIIQGHADERGTNEYNLALGERRANAIRDAYIAAGIQEDRLTTISFGEEKPAVEGSNEEAWAMNRRAVTIIH